MDHPSDVTTETLEQAEEEILTATLSDDSLEAAAATDSGAATTLVAFNTNCLTCC